MVNSVIHHATQEASDVDEPVSAIPVMAHPTVIYATTENARTVLTMQMGRVQLLNVPQLAMRKVRGLAPAL